MRLGLFLLILSILPLASMENGAIAGDRTTVLTLSGVKANGGLQSFSLAELEALGTEEVVTSTPWNTPPARFVGVPMRRLLELAGPGITSIAVKALNDYAVTIPAKQVRRYPIILASRRDGKRMPVRDKGPLWVIYPLDTHPELNIPDNHARMVWQVAEIDLR